ncbi:exodeoxyribonuclease III [Actinomycetospora flava]|uniref:Exodeoxyribonuclease III n=1 Tax=Actinomycetospora flava TaxID=3129232 RepID=A0ABU8MG13_9PSEU
MKIATYNVNGVNGRLPVLLEWLAEAGPDVVCLQELKAPQEKFPAAALRDAGYEAVWLGQKSWNGVAILARGESPAETRRGLPGEPDPGQSRYIEATVNGILIGCLYLPTGNPAPGPKFDHKLAWFEAFIGYAASLLARGVPVVLAGDYNVMPTDLIGPADARCLGAGGSRGVAASTAPHDDVEAPAGSGVQGVVAAQGVSAPAQGGSLAVTLDCGQ